MLLDTAEVMTDVLCSGGEQPIGSRHGYRERTWTPKETPTMKAASRIESYPGLRVFSSSF
jgi:hypothetical protein